MEAKYNPETPATEYLFRINRELISIREMLGTALFKIGEAESEIPEKMRRFANYMHDVHDIKFIYEEHGVPAPQYILREIERLEDRYRQLLKDLHLDGGAFEKVRREMASDKDNKHDHTRLLHYRGNGT